MQKAGQTQEKRNRIAIKPFYIQRVIMIIFCALQIILFLLFLLKFVHYIAFPIKVLFDSPSLSQSEIRDSHYLHNASLYFFFFFAHVVMALFLFKKTITSVIPHYILFERYIYNIFSSVCYLTILSLVQPLSLPEATLLTIPQVITLPLFLLGLFGFSYSLLLMYYEMFFPFDIKAILNDDVLYHQVYNKVSDRQLISNGVYSIVRHPMQASLALLVIFGGNNYTIDRLLFMGIHLTGMILGVLMEEKRLCTKFKGYPEFMKKVRYRMLPYVF